MELCGNFSPKSDATTINRMKCNVNKEQLNILWYY